MDNQQQQDTINTLWSQLLNYIAENIPVENALDKMMLEPEQREILQEKFNEYMKKQQDQESTDVLHVNM